MRRRARSSQPPSRTAIEPMNSFFSRRLLVNLAVVLIAMGANAFVAYQQIDRQSDADARTQRSLSLMRDLDAYRSALGESSRKSAGMRRVAYLDRLTFARRV